jgi:protein O-GlcNAc transferase
MGTMREMKSTRQVRGEQAFRRALDLYRKGELHAARKLLAAALPATDLLPETLQLLGVICGELGRGEEAIAHLGRAVEIAPNSASAHFNLGRISLISRRYMDAAGSLQQSIRLDSRNAEAIYLLGTAYLFLEQPGPAVDAFTGALKLDPGHKPAFVGLIESKQRLALWTDYDRQTSRLLQEAGRKGMPVSPFTLLFIADDPELQLAAARHEQEPPARNAKLAARFPAPAPLSQSRRLRLAYISADYRRHPTSRLMASFFGQHDRERFEVIGVSLSADDGSAIRKRLVASFDRLVDAQDESADAIHQTLRSVGVDIAIDLMGHTKNNRLSLYQRRVAPIQVAYLGYPGTTGAEGMDYIVLDPFIATQRVRRNLSEKPVILPDCYQVNDHHRAFPETTPSRVEHDLPAAGAVFCAFNNIRKITPNVFGVWMRILNAVPGSILWLLSDNEAVQANLRGEAAARNVSADRLIFGKVMRQEDHLARYRLADLCLDTLPCGGHTTTSDALWMGSPVLTCAGAGIAARIAGSLLQTIGMPELVTGSLAEYEALAIELARNPDRLVRIRSRLAANRLTTPLFDTPLFTRNLERAYLEMWRLHQSGEAPREIDLSRRNCAAGAGLP